MQASNAGNPPTTTADGKAHAAGAHASFRQTTTAAPLFRDGVLSILVPVYNERPYLRRCIQHVLQTELPRGLTKEIIIVDDGSTDGTAAVAQDLAVRHPDVVRTLTQVRNRGKGAAVRRAIEEMTGQYAIIQDADLEYDPADYAVMLEPLLDGSADVVYGSRFAARAMRRVLSYHHSIGNKFLTHLSNVTTGLNLTDMGTCYKAFRSDVLKTIPIRSSRFGLEPEITAKIAKRGCAVYEVPISYRGRTRLDGKKTRWTDGLKAAGAILKYWVIDDCFDECYGEAILRSLSHARRFSEWMVRVIEPYFGSRILEIGAGIGNISRHLPKREKLIVTDIDPTYLQILREAFVDHELVDVAKLDITRAEDFDAIGREVCDTIVCLNVLEHIEDHLNTARLLRRLLTPGGRLVLLVPQYPSLYGSYDRYVEHYRRYTRETLGAVLREAGFAAPVFKNFNFLSIPGWWLNSVVLQKTEMSRWQLKLYDMLVPIMRPIEHVLPLPGLSLIAVAENPG